MSRYIWVGLGGAIGSSLRFIISGQMIERFGQTFPYGTLVVNVTGSFIIGAFAALGDPDGRGWLSSPPARQFLMIGVCGGYTTFSAFSLETLRLVQGGAWPRAAVYSIASFVLCLAAVWIGHMLGTAIDRS